MNIERKKKKILAKNEKIIAKELKREKKLAEKDQNKNLPVLESKGVKKWLKKIWLKVALAVGIAGSLSGSNREVEDNKNELENNKNMQVDDMDNINKETDDRIKDFISRIGVGAIDFENLSNDDEKETEKLDKDISELKDELSKQVVPEEETADYTKKPERETIDKEADKLAKEEAGLEEDEKSVSDSVFETVVIPGKPAEDMVIEEETTKSDEGEKETVKIEINREEESKPNVIITVPEDSSGSVKYEDGTIKLEDTEKVTIEVEEKEQESQKENKHEELIEPENPFDDELEI